MDTNSRRTEILWFCEHHRKAQYSNSEYTIIDAYTLVNLVYQNSDEQLKSIRIKNGYLCTLPQNLCSQVPNQPLKLCKCKTEKEKKEAANKLAFA